MQFDEMEARELVRRIDSLMILETDYSTGRYSPPEVLTNQLCDWTRDAVENSLVFMKGGEKPSVEECKAILQATANYLNANAVGTTREELIKAGFELT